MTKRRLSSGEPTDGDGEIIGSAGKGIMSYFAL